MHAAITIAVKVVSVLLPDVIGIIVSYEVFVLIYGSKNKQICKAVHSGNNNKKPFFIESTIRFGLGFLGGLVSLMLEKYPVPAMISILKRKVK